MAVSNVRAQQAQTAAMESKERSEALAQMHLTKILRAYILQMITGGYYAPTICMQQQRVGAQLTAAVVLVAHMQAYMQAQPLASTAVAECFDGNRNTM